ncbi:hypothetical protein QA644_24515 (plasmid) [Rhizobium sp. CC1099]|uniref:hypothetical protein n=1 Tax=Rhizobium sp. CC1099 TaxID=3039160 RepID=UPI0024B08C80|nr:hypothetical protein [Rhizobium sp. CC1099]WFU91339.1 hypothetical protein QA644_24515 [Rhizobium sp. CC1099]
MHTALVIGSGIAMLFLFLLLSKLWGGVDPDFAFAAKAFVAVWFLVSVTNLWVGVTRAGYSVADELPIFCLVFAVPTLIACFTIWRSL